MKNVSIGIVGLGYWGPNLVRNFAAEGQANLTILCDLKEDLRKKISAQYPTIRTTARFEDLLVKNIDAIVIATPTASHFPIAKASLQAGKHVLIEKPIASSSAEAKALIQLSKKNKCILMVDHTFVYEDAVQKIKSYIEDGSLGDLLYFDSVRINLGIIRPDTNVLWDLAVHDLSILTYLLPNIHITDISVRGFSHYTKKMEDAHLHFRINDVTEGHIHVSWLSPVKIRQTLIGGTKNMILYNDNEPSEKIRLYDRDRNFIIPQLKTIEPLKELARHFCACIQGKEEPRTPGEHGLKVVEILEKADASLTKAVSH